MIGVVDETDEQEDRDRAALRDLVSTVDAFGHAKKKGHSFCLRCYRKLRPAMREKLYTPLGYTPLGKGYTEIYEEAKAALQNRER